MSINIVSRESSFSQLIKNRFILFEKRAAIADRPIKTKIYILGYSQNILWPQRLLYWITKWEDIKCTNLFRKILGFSNRADFRNCLSNFENDNQSRKYIMLCDGGIIFINRQKRIDEISYFTYKRYDIRKSALYIGSVLGSIYKIVSYLSSCSSKFLIHAAGIKNGEDAYIFIGKSGSGKTTICTLSQQYVILNDDMLMADFNKKDNIFEIFLPYNPSVRAKLKYIFFLRRDRKNMLVPMSIEERIRHGIGSIQDFSPNLPTPPFLGAKIDYAIDLFKNVPAYRLHFKKDPTFWALINKLNRFY